MGFGDKKKGKGNGDDEDAGKNMRRKPGESGDDLVRRLGKNVAAAGKQICGTCGGTMETGGGGAQMTPGGKQKGNMGDAKACTCNRGWRQGRVR